MSKKIIFGILLNVTANGNYLGSIMDDSMIMCDEIIESQDEDAKAKSYNKRKAIQTKFN